MSNEKRKKDVLLWKFQQIKVLSYSHVWFSEGGRRQKIMKVTPDYESEISSIPSGGCGALLHCKDVALPGYLPMGQ